MKKRKEKEPIPLIKGKRYQYWNRRLDEMSSSLKTCILRGIHNRDGKVFAVSVERPDLQYNNIQTIELRRLLKHPEETYEETNREITL